MAAGASGNGRSVRAVMTRSIALALGALVSVFAVGALVTAWRGASEHAAKATIAIEDWPICSTVGPGAGDTDWTQLDPDFADGKKALAAGDWNAAITALELAALRDPQSADIQNHIGYAYRRLRQFEPAFTHYRLAVVLNPRHRSAHEHLGEAYLVQGDLAKAEGHLAALEEICLIPCVEYRDLRVAIAAYKKSAAR
jgi:tetratricopeptide (TPR) repeat protein